MTTSALSLSVRKDNIFWTSMLRKDYLAPEWCTMCNPVSTSGKFSLDWVQNRNNTWELIYYYLLVQNERKTGKSYLWICVKLQELFLRFYRQGSVRMLLIPTVFSGVCKVNRQHWIIQMNRVRMQRMYVRDIVNSRNSFPKKSARRQKTGLYPEMIYSQFSSE